MRACLFLFSFLGFVGTPMAAPAKVEPVFETIVLTRALSTQSWTPCNSRIVPCATTYSIIGFDQKGRTRLIYTLLGLQEGKDEASLARVTTAFVVRDEQVISNYGNQYPDPASEQDLSRALFFLAPECPATIKVSEKGKVLSAASPCYETGP